MGDRLRHTADRATQPGLAAACEEVCRLEPGQCLFLSRADVVMLQIRPNPHIGGSPYDRIASNIIGAAHELTLREHEDGSGATFCRVERGQGT